jgi:hypothetical protein
MSVRDTDASDAVRRHVDRVIDGEIRAFDHVEGLSVPGETVQAFLGVDPDGTAFWAITGCGYTNVYTVGKWPDLEEAVAVHNGVARESVERRTS